jgi:hypothetical protein
VSIYWLNTAACDGEATSSKELLVELESVPERSGVSLGKDSEFDPKNDAFKV